MSVSPFRHKFLIIKADDFGRSDMQDAWRHFIDVCLTNYAKPSVGIIANALIGSKSSQQLGRYHHEINGVEFWNHSSAHSAMTKLSTADRIADIQQSQAVIADAIGSAPAVFGPPFNIVDPASISDVLDAYPFAVTYCCEGVDRMGTVNIDRQWLISCEISTQTLNRVSRSFFLDLFRRRGEPEVLMMQVHPGYWRREDVQEFERVLRFAFDLGYQPVTAQEYAAYLGSVDQPPEDAPAGIAGVAARQQELLYANLAGGIPAILTDPDRDYYFAGGMWGTARLAQFLRHYGLAAAGERPKPLIVEVGAGLGNWAMAAKTAVPHAIVQSIGPDPDIVDLISPILGSEDEWAPLPAIACVAADPASLDLAGESVDYLLFSNSLNLVPADMVLREFSRVVRSSGSVVFGVQNALHPIVCALGHLERGDVNAARVSIDRLLGYLSRRAATGGRETPIRYWSDLELTNVALFSGLHPMYRGIPFPEDFGSLFGSPSLWGYAFMRTASSARRGMQLRSGQGVSATEYALLCNAGADDVLQGLAEAGWQPAETDGRVAEEIGLAPDEAMAIGCWLLGEDAPVDGRESFVLLLVSVASALRSATGAEIAAAVYALLLYLADDDNRRVMLSGERVEPPSDRELREGRIAEKAGELDGIIERVRRGLGLST